jgi:hypothetical protein
MIKISNGYFFVLGLTSLTLCLMVGGCGDDDDPTSDGSCVENGEPPWSCYYDTNATTPGDTSNLLKGCYQYADTVTEEQAADECPTHELGGQLKVIHNPKLRNCPCSLDRVSGFCVVPVASGDIPGPPLPGKEWTQYKALYNDANNPYGDCDQTDDPIGGGDGCGYAGGTYTCYFNEDNTLKDEYANVDGTLMQPLP